MTCGLVFQNHLIYYFDYLIIIFTIIYLFEKLDFVFKNKLALGLSKPFGPFANGNMVTELITDII